MDHRKHSQEGFSLEPRLSSLEGTVGVMWLQKGEAGN